MTRVFAIRSCHVWPSGWNAAAQNPRPSGSSEGINAIVRISPARTPGGPPNSSTDRRSVTLPDGAHPYALNTQSVQTVVGQFDASDSESSPTSSSTDQR